MGSSLYRPVSCQSSAVTAEVHEKSLGHFGYTLPPDLVLGFLQSAAHDLCSLQPDSACLLPSRLGLHSSLPAVLEQLLSPTPVLPGSHWGITSLHPAHKSPSLDHIASSCPSADWLHPVPGTPSHLSICVFLIIYPLMQWPHFSRLNLLNVISCLGLLTSPGPFCSHRCSRGNVTSQDTTWGQDGDSQ